ncbi:MAG: BatD family protein [Thermoguttaceae bacterium]
MPKRLQLWNVAALLAVIVSFFGCGRHAPPGTEQTEQKPKVATSQVERGPVRMSVTIDPSPARLSDEPTLTLEIAYAQGITIHKPEFGSALGEFVIRDFREPLPRVEGDRQILQQVYTLEPTRAGKFVIDPISITFTDDHAVGSDKEHTLQTEPITVEVAAAVAQEAPSLDQLRGPADPLPLPPSFSPARWWIAVAAAAVVLAAAVAWWLRCRKRTRSARVPTPAELANLELQRLRESDLAARDVKLFYVELTAVVRRYIERTKGIHAPEQTTQEFLQEISLRKDFPAEQSRRLRSFLEAADLVKFAAHQPHNEDVEESFRRANAFVGCADREEVAA